MMDSTLNSIASSTVTESSSSSSPCCREKSQSHVEESGGSCITETPRSRYWKIGDFLVEEKLYDNGTSRVYKARFRASGVAVAIKLYVKDRLHPVHHHQVRREIRIHSAIHHPNIVELYGSFEDEEYYYLVTEYANKGDLFDYTRTRQCGVLTEEETVSIVVLPMLNALEYLHARGIIHRDIKPENILLASHPSGVDGTKGGITAKLADFGLALNQMEERPVTRVGTLEYMPPEVVKNPGKSTPTCNKDREDLTYAEKADVWSLSVLAFEMLYSFPTFGTNEKSSVKALIEQSIMVSKPRFFPEIREISHGAQDFITQCLRKAPSSRPSVAALKRHRWIQETLLMGSGNNPDLIRSAYKAAAVMRPDHIKAAHRDPEWSMAPSSNTSDGTLFPEICEQKAHSQKLLRPKQPDHPSPHRRLSHSTHDGCSSPVRLDKLAVTASHRSMRHSLDSPNLTRQAVSPAQARRSLNLTHPLPPKLGRHSMDAANSSPTRQASSPTKTRQSLDAPSSIANPSSLKPTRRSLEPPSIANEASPQPPKGSFSRPLKQSPVHDRFALFSHSTAAAAAQNHDSKGSSRANVLGHDNARASYRQWMSSESTRMMTKHHQRHEEAQPQRRMSSENREHAELGGLFSRGKTWKMWQMKT